MKKMSPDRALIRARSIWGKKGWVDLRRSKEGGVVCHVGRLDGVGGIQFFSIKGTGPDFEAAFAAYERSEKMDRMRWRSDRLYDAVTKCRQFVQGLALDGPAGEQAATLDNELTTLIDEIEGGA